MFLKDLRLALKALGEDTRLRIVNILQKKELTVKEICYALQVSQPSCSKHLARLRLLEIVIDRREGNLIFYRLNSDSAQSRIVSFVLKENEDLPEFKKDIKKLKV